MKYLRVFNNDSEYQTFISGADYVTPNICLNKETLKIKLEPDKIAELTFPVYLDNSDYELGVEVYNYLYNKYDTVNRIDIDEEIYIYIEDYNEWGRLTYLDAIIEKKLVFKLEGYYTTVCIIFPIGGYDIAFSSGSGD